MRYKDLMTSLLIVFWLMFVLILPLSFGISKHILILIMFYVSLSTLIPIAPHIIICWYDNGLTLIIIG